MLLLCSERVSEAISHGMSWAFFDVFFFFLAAAERLMPRLYSFLLNATRSLLDKLEATGVPRGPGRMQVFIKRIQVDSLIRSVGPKGS